MALSFIQRMVEEKIREAQRSGTFDNLSGKGEPLELENLSSVPEDLRMAYHLLKNAHVLPPEMELRKGIHSLRDLLKVVEEEGQRKGLLKDIEQKIIQLDLLKRRSLSVTTVNSYSQKLRNRLYPDIRNRPLPGDS